MGGRFAVDVASCSLQANVTVTVTVKSEICFDRGQFAGGAKNLQDQCAGVIYPPKICQYD